ncbi:MAG: carbon-nitrogen hydrolase family protein [Candidatus Promineifilaceae bacterium]|nr:carbon-nitrogen hydrolase family protein [Candidatus Promineifilaceae bacterium]
MKILAYQPLIHGIKSVADRRNHVQRMAQNIDDRCRREDDVAFVLLPELSTVEYSRTSFARLMDLAEPSDGETYQIMSALARKVGCSLSYGFPQEHNGDYFITQAVLDPQGRLITAYNKVHLAQLGASMEKDYFSCGRKLSVFELGGYRFGIIICYDFRFSGFINQLVNTHNIDVILHPVAFQKDSTYRSWHPFAIARALEYQVYFLSLNRAGMAYGGSILCPPWIDDDTDPIILNDEEEIKMFTLDKRVINSVRENYTLRKDSWSDYSHLGT